MFGDRLLHLWQLSCVTHFIVLTAAQQVRRMYLHFTGCRNTGVHYHSDKRLPALYYAAIRETFTPVEYKLRSSSIAATTPGNNNYYSALKL